MQNGHGVQPNTAASLSPSSLLTSEISPHGLRRNHPATPIFAGPGVVGARASDFVHLHQEGGAEGAGAGAAAAPSYLMRVPRVVAALLVRLQESLGSVDTLDQKDAEVGLRTLGSKAAVFEARWWHTLAIAGRKPAVRIAAAAALGSRCIPGTFG